jgi:Predicted acyltransferase
VALFGTDPLEELLVPDGTHAQEHDLVTDGDVIVASQSTMEFGVRGGNVIAGEGVEFGGDIEAEGDCRLDTWCDVAGNVLAGEDAYLGGRAHIGGELRVAGNLDIGDDVQIDNGFEANGWIVIRNPMPTVVFLFIYLSQLLRIGEQEAAEQLLDAVTDADKREHDPVLVPRGSQVGDDAWRVSTPGRVGDDCRLHGNIRAESLVVGRENELFGSLRAREGITVGAGTEVTGNVTTRTGTVRIGPGATVRGDVAGEFVEVHREAEIEGAIRASEEMSIVSDPVLDAAVTDADDSTGSDERPTDEQTPPVNADDPDKTDNSDIGEADARGGRDESDSPPTEETPDTYESSDGTQLSEVPFAETRVETDVGATDEAETGESERTEGGKEDTDEGEIGEAEETEVGEEGTDEGETEVGEEDTDEGETEGGETEVGEEDTDEGETEGGETETGETRGEGEELPIEEAESRGPDGSNGSTAGDAASTTGRSNDAEETGEDDGSGVTDSVPSASPRTADDSG